MAAYLLMTHGDQVAWEAMSAEALLPEAPGGAASGVEIRGCWGGA